MFNNLGQVGSLNSSPISAMPRIARNTPMGDPKAKKADGENDSLGYSTNGWPVPAVP